MVRIDQKPIPTSSDEVRVFIVGVDSAHFIPHLVNHYLNIGNTRIFYIDNDSKDDSVRKLLKYDRVHVWSQQEEFSCGEYDDSSVKCGAAWVEELLKKYGNDTWCLTVDTDELFIYPGYEAIAIEQYVHEIQLKGHNCIQARHIDMYANDLIENVCLKQSLIETCPYYDLTEYGCRERVFHFKSHYLKIPLFKYDSSVILKAGYHDLKREEKKVDNYTCGILHFKFTSNLSKFIQNHGEKMPDAGIKSEMYLSSSKKNLYNPKVSKRYQGSQDLDFFQQFEFRSI